MNTILKIFDLDWWMDINNNAAEIADAVLFLLLAIPVIYLFIYAAASMQQYRNNYPATNKKHKFLVLYTALRDGKDVIDSIQRFFETQQYPRDKYDIAVSATQLPEEDLTTLLSMPVNVIIPDKEICTRTYAVQQAVARYTPKEYDVVVLLNADNVLAPNALELLNNAYYAGCDAIQTHRVTQNLNTPTAILSATAEEINNHIFRKGHTKLGFSSALVGSGMAFNFEFFKQIVSRLSGGDFTKDAELVLLKENIYTEYLEDVNCYCKKTEHPSEYSRERRTWLGKQLASTWTAIISFPLAFLQGKWDLCDKLFQWLMPSRFLLILCLLICTLAFMMIEWPLSVKWFVLDLFFIITILMAMPEGELNSKFRKSIWVMPFVVVASFFAFGKKK